LKARRKKITLSLSSITVLSVTAAAVIAVSVCIGIFASVYSKALLRDARVSTEQTADQTALFINNYLSSMKEKLNLINGIVSDTKTPEELSGRISALTYIQNDIYAVTVYGKNGEIVSCTGSGAALKGSIYKDASFDKELFETSGGYILSAPHVQTLFENEYPWVVTLAVKTDEPVFENGAYIAIDFNFSEIAKYISSIGVGRQGYCYIADISGNIVYHPQQQLLYAGLKKEEAGRLACLGDGTYVEDTVIYSVQRVPGSTWRVVGVSYIDETVNESFRQMVRITVITAGLVFLAALAAGWVLSRLLSRPLQQLETAMEQFEQDADHFAFQAVRGTREVQNLSDSFGHMVGRIQQLMTTVREEEIVLRKTELKALQAQINPHFLYNTLDSIAWMCERGKNADAVQMVHALARLFRISISRGHELIPIEKELQHAEAYLQIQKYRYKNQFTYHFTVDESCLHCLCNKITLQPIIENAIVHGLDLMVDSGHIEITVKPDGDDILLIVADDGIGMEPEQVAALLQNEPSDRTGIGVKNVNDRLRIYFGADYGISIESAPYEGTTVTIRTPRVPEDREGDYDKNH